MVEIIRKIVFNVLAALYQPFGVALIMTILFMTVYMFVEDYGLKPVVQHWIENMRKNATFQRVCVLTFYTAMILFRTLLNRNVWDNPFSDVIGVWGLRDANGELTTEVLENLALFIPFTVLLLWCFRERILGQVVNIGKSLWQSVRIVFLFSLGIEFLQLFLHIGTFQLSDLFYNTLGGFIGGLIYWCGYKIAHRNKKDGAVGK